MAHEVKMPKLGLTMESGTIQSWMVANGTSVEAGDVLMVIETEKTESEIEAEVSGVLKQIIMPGIEVPVETVLGYIL